MISHKPGVRIGLCHWIVGHMAVIADQVYGAHDEFECVITSAMDGVHSVGSLHYSGQAIDLRLPNDRSKCGAIKLDLANRLGDDFDVVLEADHLHLELQAKQPYR